MNPTEHGRSNGPDRLPGWQELERRLSGSADLGALIDELSAHLAEPTSPFPSVREALGDHLGAVLERGLAAVPAEALEPFLRQPPLLRDLQGLIFTAGGAYWAEQIKAAARELPEELKGSIERIRHELELRMHGD